MLLQTMFSESKQNLLSTRIRKVVKVVGDKPKMQVLNVALLHFCMKQMRNIDLICKATYLVAKYILSAW